jgi:hypothetical protein
MENNLNTAEPPAQPTAVITLLPGELWCIRCGNDGNVYAGDSRVNNVRMCSRCESRNLVPAVAVLRPDEYILMAQ